MANQPKQKKERRRQATGAALRSDEVVTLSVGAGDPLQAAGLFDHLAVVMKDARRARRPKAVAGPKRLRVKSSTPARRKKAPR